MLPSANLPAKRQNAPCWQGIEIIKTTWIEARLAQSGEPFEQQYFTAAERYQAPLRIPYIQHLASRFAAKSAVIQILSSAQSQGFQPKTDSSVGAVPWACPWQWWRDISWCDIEIQNLPHGEPTVRLYGGCQQLAATCKITQWLLSLSHTPAYAAASAIAMTKLP